MKLISITFIMMYLAAAGFSYNLPGVTFWNVIYGFAAMLALFQLLNLRVFWASTFGALAYIVIAVKMTGTISTAQLYVSPGHIAGLAVAAVFCCALAIHGGTNRHARQSEDPETLSRAT